jgi:hypothetical protein
MKVLFDQGAPVPLRRFLQSHQVDTCADMGWSTLQNGDLLSQAEQASYEAFITTDRNLRYQQDLSGRNIRILVLGTTSWPRISKKTDEVLAALDDLGFVG